MGGSKINRFAGKSIRLVVSGQIEIVGIAKIGPLSAGILFA
jgi:hypothetical protein